jgi:hypothetical protein
VSQPLCSEKKTPPRVEALAAPVVAIQGFKTPDGTPIPNGNPVPPQFQVWGTLNDFTGGTMYAQLFVAGTLITLKNRGPDSPWSFAFNVDTTGFPQGPLPFQVAVYYEPQEQSLFSDQQGFTIFSGNPPPPPPPPPQPMVV